MSIDRDSQPPLLDELIAQQVDLPPPPTFEPVKDDGKGKVAASSSGSTGSGEKKIPKWLKLGNSECSRVGRLLMLMRARYREVNAAWLVDFFLSAIAIFSLLLTTVLFCFAASQRLSN